jgi:membrane protease YdiL (CAAX protease family)
MDRFPLWADHIVAFLFGFAIPLYTAYRRPKDFFNQQFDSEQKKQIYLSGSFSLFIMALIIVVVWLLFKRPLANLGLTQPADGRSWLWIAFVFVALYILDTWQAVGTDENLSKALSRWKKRTPFMPTQRHELPLYLLMCFSAGVFEEIIFRGFLVTYCFYLFSGFSNPELWAVIIPAVIFSVAHYYQGSRAVLKIVVLSILFGFLFIRSGSLLAVMLLHFLVDVAGGLLAMRYIKETGGTDNQ